MQSFSLICPRICIGIKEVAHFNYFAVDKCEQAENVAFKGTACISGDAFTFKDDTYLVPAIDVFNDADFIITKSGV